LTFAFTVDLEDWYQGIELPFDSWHKYEYRVEKGLDKLLFLLSENDTKATFFTLGWIAQKYPQIIKRVQKEGHELASHGFTHEKVYDLTPDAFRKEVRETKATIEDLIGKEISAFRAPFFSVTTKSLWALQILAEENYTIDCSISPVKTWRYGISSCPSTIFKIKNINLTEFPVSTYNVLHKKLAIGGAYFRLFPYALNRHHLKKRAQKNQHTMFYIHPWEYDPDHPVVDMEKKAKFTHYTNLGKTYTNTDRLLKEFNFGTVTEVITDYLNKHECVELELESLHD